MDDSFRLVFMTAANKDEAATIAEALVGERLAACVNIVYGCRSIYRWQGKIVRDDEVLMLAKIKASDFAVVEKKVLELHSYDVPEIIAVDLTAIASGYRSFLEDCLGGNPRSK